ncbi:MAG: ABC transporter permease, partial [Rhodobacteraceae bacterium]|nr:ABC transporter permease [Paracoccaceae bacterium]
MDPLTWTGSLGALLNPIFQGVALIFIAAVALQIIASFIFRAAPVTTNADGTLTSGNGPIELITKVSKYSLFGLIGLALIYLLAGVVMPFGKAGIIGAVSARLAPVWLALFVTFTLSMVYKRKLGLYGKLFDSLIGMIGFGLVMFWVYTA